MTRRRMIVVGLTLMGVIALNAPNHVDAAPTPPPTCVDLRDGSTHTATKWLTVPGTLTGTNGRDVLVGSTGNDVIRGLGGDDIICGVDGSDTLDGGAGHDSIEGSKNYYTSTTATGGQGDDWINVIGSAHGNAGNDHIQVIYGYAWGDAGNDYVESNSGRAAYGGAGDDYVFSVAADFADGGSGDDTVIGMYSNAVIKGGSGNDTLGTSPDYLAKQMDGGAGNDVCTTLGIPAKSCEVRN